MIIYRFDVCANSKPKTIEQLIAIQWKTSLQIDECECLAPHVSFYLYCEKQSEQYIF